MCTKQRPITLELTECLRRVSQLLLNSGRFKVDHLIIGLTVQMAYCSLCKISTATKHVSYARRIIASGLHDLNIADWTLALLQKK